MPGASRLPRKPRIPRPRQHSTRLLFVRQRTVRQKTASRRNLPKFPGHKGRPGKPKPVGVDWHTSRPAPIKHAPLHGRVHLHAKRTFQPRRPGLPRAADLNVPTLITVPARDLRSTRVKLLSPSQIAASRRRQTSGPGPRPRHARSRRAR